MKTFPFETILNWYKKNGRHELPWRQKQTPYHVWISEIFLQQTQVSRVINYFEKVTEAFPNIKSFSRTDYETFFPYYE
jgi:A/G-specific adenine glycosylase